VTSVDKANVLETFQFWKDVVTEVHAQYPDVELSTCTSTTRDAAGAAPKPST
jgi:isocitrate/isopropylmalate dehydrogenase